MDKRDIYEADDVSEFLADVGDGTVITMVGCLTLVIALFAVLAYIAGIF